MLIEAAMSTPLHTVAEHETVIAAAKRMRDVKVAFLPVCDRFGHLVGTITERDVARRFVADESAGSTRVSQIMDRIVPTCRARDDLRDARTMMDEYRVHRLVCLDDRDWPVGILALSDVARHERRDRITRPVTIAQQATRPELTLCTPRSSARGATGRRSTPR
jgi:CBS domain-containing protein